MMKTLFVGDVHGCHNELAIMLQKVQPTRCILVGDIFRKGPDPIGVWNLIKTWSLEGVFGNHEAALLREMDDYPAELVTWVESLPLWIDGVSEINGRHQAWRVVHAGVNPYDIDATTRSQAIVLRRWPNDSQLQNPFWWSIYSGESLIIYGHDAQRGLQDHRPKTLGLDSGCVYGNGLTGYIAETDTLVHVPSQQIYVSV